MLGPNNVTHMGFKKKWLALGREVMSGRMNTRLDRELRGFLLLHFYFLKEAKNEQNVSRYFEVLWRFFNKECVHKWVERVVSSCHSCSGVAPSLTWFRHFFWALPKVNIEWHCLRGLSWSRLLKENNLCNRFIFWLYSKVKCLCILCFPITLSLFCAFLKI